jgi:hypothetical protein
MREFAPIPDHKHNEEIADRDFLEGCEQDVNEVSFTLVYLYGYIQG